MRFMTVRALPMAAVLLAIGLADCSLEGPPEWQKAGATSDAMAADIKQCRTTARDRAGRFYPQTIGNPALSGGGMVGMQQQASSGRSIAEVEMFNTCMQGRGYTREDKLAG
jgi:hypothetical protein